MSFLPFKRTNQPPSLSKNSNKITHYYCNDSVTIASLVFVALSISALIFATLVPQHNPFSSIRRSMSSVATSVIESPASGVITTFSQRKDDTMVKKNSREDKEWNRHVLLIDAGWGRRLMTVTRLAVHMDSYHNSFRLEFKRVYTVCLSGSLKLCLATLKALQCCLNLGY